MSATTLSVAAGVIQIAILSLYAMKMFKGQFKPSRITWFSYALLSTTVAFAMAQAGTLNGLIVAGAVGNTAIFLLSLKYGEKGWRWLDVIALVGVGTVFVVWMATQNPLFAILGPIILVQVGSLPTYNKAWRRPMSEPLLPWTIALIPPILEIFAIELWVIEEWAQPVFYIITPTTVITLLLLGRRRERMVTA